MSSGLQGVELNYPLVDKQAFAIHKAMKQFKPYIFKNHTKLIVPHLEVRYLFVDTGASLHATSRPTSHVNAHAFK
jgi:hypothetical protein